MNYHIHERYPHYIVFTNGDVFSLLTYKFLKPAPLEHGYLRVRLKDKHGDFKDVLLHRLVAEVFIPNPFNLPEVNHKDENVQNPSVENLEWCEHKYNINYGNHTKKSCETRRLIDYSWKTPILQLDISGNLIKRWKSQKEASRAGCNQGNIGECARGKRKTAHGFIWRYAESEVV